MSIFERCTVYHYPDSHSLCLVILNSTYGLEWFLKYDISEVKFLYCFLYCFLYLFSPHVIPMRYFVIITAICLNYNAILDYYIYSMFFYK